MEYKKFIHFLNRYFSSPITVGGNMFYEYRMMDLIPNLTVERFETDFFIIIEILKYKFRDWTLRYYKSEVGPEGRSRYTLNEFKRIIRDIYPNFYWMNQKNMLANLETFANMNNWGQKEVSEMKQLIVENYIPLNNDIETPHSSTPTTSNHNSQMIDFIKYYQSISMLDNKLFDNLYSHFLPLFKMIYV